MKFIYAVVVLLAQPAFSQPHDDSISFAIGAPAPAGAGVSERSNKKIGMVTSTLKDILQSVVNEEKAEAALFSKYMDWCKSQTGSIAGDLAETQTQLKNAKVLSEEQTSNIDALGLFIQKNTKDIDETKDAIAQAVALRTDENEKYTEELQINTQSLRQIDLAIKHVGKVQKQGGFLQNGVMKKLQVNQPGESGYVMGVMKGLKDKLEKSRTVLKKMEADKVTMHNSFMDTKGKSMKAMMDLGTDKKIAYAETKAKEAGVKKKIGKLTEEVAALIASAGKTSENCQTTRSEWTVRQADRTKEKAALNEAIRYLTETAFEQMSVAQETTYDKSDEEHAPVVFAPSFLQEASAMKISDNEFYAAASAELSGEDEEVEGHLKKDTFNGVKSVVQKLIGSHQDTQKEETGKKAYCEKELADKDDEKSTTSDALAAVKANIDKKSTEVITLADEVKQLYASIETSKKGLEDAGKVRKQETTLFVAGSKDRALAIKVLSQAKTVLQNFYDQSQGNLLQAAAAPAGASPPPKKWSRLSPAKKEGAFGAVSMVQDIADDITKEQKDASISEKQASDAYAELQEDTQTSRDNKQQDITDRVVSKAKLGVQINGLKETQTQNSDDLIAINKQLKALHDSCDELLKFYDKRQKGRGFEVSQLRDVMDILSGSSLSARTGLLQEAADDDDAAAEEA